MNSDIIISLVTLLGSAVGTFGGILLNTRLTNYRIEQLEKKVDKHNNFALRIPVIEEKIRSVQEKVLTMEEKGNIYENFKMDDCPHNYDRFGGC